MPRSGHRARPTRPGPARPHHISAVAHLFFDESAGAEKASVTAPWDLAVLAAAAGAGARIAAGLAAAAAACRPDLRVCLIEDRDLPESALALADRQGVVRAGELAAGGLRIMEMSGSSTSAVRPDRPLLRWRHWGVPQAAVLRAWETAAGAPPLSFAANQRWAGLVWCMPESVASHLAPVAALGRLVRILRPGRLEIVVSQAEAGGERPERAAALARLRRLSTAVIGGVPAEVSLIGAGGGTAVMSSLTAIAARLCPPPASSAEIY